MDSARFSPSALTLIWTSPFPGGGTSSSSIWRTSGPPVSWNRTTRAMTLSCCRPTIDSQGNTAVGREPYMASLTALLWGEADSGGHLGREEPLRVRHRGPELNGPRLRIDLRIDHVQLRRVGILLVQG